MQARDGTAGAGASPAGSVEAAARTILPSVVQVRAERGSGSGVIMDDRGHVLTNHHVVAGADEVTLVLSTGRRVSAEVVGSEPGRRHRRAPGHRRRSCPPPGWGSARTSGSDSR